MKDLKHILVIIIGSLLGVPAGVVYAQNVVTYAFDSAFPVHAPTSDTSYQYSYDLNGNVETITQTGTSEQTIYSYTTFNKLERATLPDGTAVSYLYDVTGTRIAKTDDSGNILEWYFGAVEKRTEGIVRYYHAGPKRLAKRIDNGNVSFIHQDHLGSTSVIAAQDGTTVRENEYYEFGALKSESGSDRDPFGYNDKRLDGETKLNDYDARSLATRSFRFLQPDSIVPNPVSPQEFNRYSYVKSNPLRYIDPTGHSTLQFDLPDDMAESMQGFAKPSADKFTAGPPLYPPGHQLEGQRIPTIGPPNGSQWVADHIRRAIPGATTVLAMAGVEQDKEEVIRDAGMAALILLLPAAARTEEIVGSAGASMRFNLAGASAEGAGRHTATSTALVRVPGGQITQHVSSGFAPLEEQLAALSGMRGGKLTVLAEGEAGSARIGLWDAAGIARYGRGEVSSAPSSGGMTAERFAELLRAHDVQPAVIELQGCGLGIKPAPFPAELSKKMPGTYVRAPNGAYHVRGYVTEYNSSVGSTKKIDWYRQMSLKDSWNEWYKPPNN